MQLIKLLTHDGKQSFNHETKGESMKKQLLFLAMVLLLACGTAGAQGLDCNLWHGTWEVTLDDDTTMQWIFDDPQDPYNSNYNCVLWGSQIQEGQSDLGVQIMVFKFVTDSYMFVPYQGALSDYSSLKLQLNAGATEFTVLDDAISSGVASGVKLDGDENPLPVPVDPEAPAPVVPTEDGEEETIAVLVTDWGTPQGADFEYYYRNIADRSRVGIAAQSPDEPCTEGFNGIFPYRSQIGVLPHAIAFETQDLEFMYDSYGIYWRPGQSPYEPSDTVNYINIYEPALKIHPDDLPVHVVVDPVRDIKFGRGRAIYDPDTRDGTDHCADMVIIGEPWTLPTGQPGYRNFANGVRDIDELDTAYWWRVVRTMGIEQYADGPRMHPFTIAMEEDLHDYFQTYFGSKVDLRFGMYEVTANFNKRHEDVALEFARDGYKRMVVSRETTDNNNYANKFMTRSHIDIALCEEGFDDLSLTQVRQVGRTPEYNTMLLTHMEGFLEKMNPADSPVSLVYITYGNPWPGTSENINSPFAVSHPWVSDPYPENAYYNFLSFKRVVEDRLAGRYNIQFNRPGTDDDFRTNNYYAYGMFQPEYYTAPGQAESEFKTVRQSIDQVKQDGGRQMLLLFSHWYYDSIDNGMAVRDVNDLPFNSYADLENEIYWIDWCENPEPGDNTWTEMSPAGHTCSNPNDVYIMMTNTFDDYKFEFNLNYANRIRGGVERHGTFPNLGIQVEARGEICALNGGMAEVTTGSLAGSKLVVPADPDPTAPEGLYPGVCITGEELETCNDIKYETVNDPDAPKVGAWDSYTAFIGTQADVEPGVVLPDVSAGVRVAPRVYFGPYRTLFNKPARITLAYDASKVTDPASIKPYIFNDLTRQWDYHYPVPAAQGTVIDTSVATVTFDTQVLGIFTLVDESGTPDASPELGDGPFLAAGPWPLMSTSAGSAFVLDVNYDVLWAFSDDFASCPGACTHSAEYSVAGSDTWSALAVIADAANGRARVTLPVESLQNATTYAFRFTVTDCANQSTQSGTYYFRVATSDAPPVIIDGPFLAAGSWPVFPISESQAFVLNQGYDVLWTFSDDYAICSDLSTHLFRYRKVGDEQWSTLPVSTDPEGKWYAYVTLPVESMENGTYEFRMNVKDCADQWGNSGPKFFKFKVER
jgi:hypothetical protein